jgi:hypothetical protein
MGILQKRGYTRASGQLGATDTNAGVMYNVRVGSSFYELVVSVPISEEKGYLKCEIEEPERRTMESSLAYSVGYATRQATKEWTASVTVTPTALTLKTDPFQRLFSMGLPQSVNLGSTGGGRGGQPAAIRPMSMPSSAGPMYSGSGRTCVSARLSNAVCSLCLSVSVCVNLGE